MLQPLSSRASRITAVTGLCVYGAGMAVAEHATLGVALRVAGLAILALVAVSRRSITVWTFYSILVGTEIGADAPGMAIHLHVLAEIFLRLVRVVVAPLILGSLATGIAGHGQLRSLGRIAWKMLLYFEIVTTLGLVLGAVMIDLTRAGEGITLPSIAASGAAPTLAHPGFESFLLNMFPENIALAVAQNQILQVSVFAIFFGTALAMLSDEKKAPVLSLLRSLTDTMFQFTKIIMYFAPVAAGAAMAYTVGSMGWAACCRC